LRGEMVMVSPARVGVSGPLEPFAVGFAAELSGLGYTPRASVFQLQLMAHVSRWLDGEGLGAADLTPVVVERFVVARRGAGYALHRSPRALVPLLGYLRSVGVTPPAPEVEVAGVVEQLLLRYRRYLMVERGLAEVTVAYYVKLVRPFLVAHASAGSVDLEGLDAGDVSAFVLAESRRLSRGSVANMVTALRSLLGFLHVDGVLEISLTGAVPSVAQWRLAGLPRGLEPGVVRALLASCDRRTIRGRRDFAILMLLARLGLRACEVSGLALEDLDWRAGELVVAGKGDRRERLPLPADVGEAVAGWLRRGRPASAQGRSVFVRVRAPHRPLSSRGVGAVVSAAGRRVGVSPLGAHRLRHTAASEMLRAGVPLREIGQVLRHRRLETTAIYAKVDHEALRSLARPWPVGGVA
jgi:integrase/recombinase XerD